METPNIGRQILKTVVSAGTKAIQDYIEMAGDAAAGDMPEYWLTSEIARALGGERQYYVQLEKNVSTILQYANSSTQMPHGKLDIALYERAPLPADPSLKLKCVVEIKLIKAEYSFNDDARRIIKINRVRGSAAVSSTTAIANWR